MDSLSPRRRAPAVVSGGTGFIGAHLARSLATSGTQVVVASRPGSDRSRLANLREEITFAEFETWDCAVWSQFLDAVRPQTVFHLASTPFRLPPALARQHRRVIVEGTSALIEAARTRAGVGLIFTGSAAEYGEGLDLSEEQALRPGTCFGKAKAAACELVREHARATGQRCVWLRIFTPFGPWEAPSRLTASVARSAVLREPVRLRHPHAMRDFVYIDDVVAALLAAAERPLAPGTVLNLCSGQPTQVFDLAREIVSASGYPVPIEADPAGGEDPDLQTSGGNGTKAEKLLGWRPRVNQREGLERTVSWWKENLEWQPRSN